MSHTSGIAGQRERGGRVRQRGGGESHLWNSRAEREWWDSQTEGWG